MQNMVLNSNAPMNPWPAFYKLLKKLFDVRMVFLVMVVVVRLPLKLSILAFLLSQLC